MICTVCTNCCREVMGEPEPYDHPETALVEGLCPDCFDKLMAHEPGETYYDDDGNEIVSTNEDEGDKHGNI